MAVQEMENRLPRPDTPVKIPAVTAGDLPVASAPDHLRLQSEMGNDLIASADPATGEKNARRGKVVGKSVQSSAFPLRSGHVPPVAIREPDNRGAESTSIKETTQSHGRLNGSEKPAIASDGTHGASLHASSAGKVLFQLKNSDPAPVSLHTPSIGNVLQTDSAQVLTKPQIHSDLARFVSSRQAHPADSPSARATAQAGESSPSGITEPPAAATPVMAQTVRNGEKSVQQVQPRSVGVVHANSSALKETQTMKATDPVFGEQEIDAKPQERESTAVSGSAVRNTAASRKGEIISDPLVMRPMSPAEQFAVFSRSRPVSTAARSVNGQIAQQLADWMGKASFHLEQGSVKSLTMTLYPQNLGQVTVTVTQSDAGIVAHLLTSTKAARELIHSGLDQLRSDIASQGIFLHHLDVSRQWQSYAAGEPNQSGQGKTDQNAQDQSDENEEQKKKKRSSFIDPDGNTKAFLNWLKGGAPAV